MQVEKQMKYLNGKECTLEAVKDKAEMRGMLADSDWAFSKDELEALIHNEFFNDANPLDMELVDMVVTRMLLFEGIQPDADTLQKAREEMISGVLRKLLKPNK